MKKHIISIFSILLLSYSCVNNNTNKKLQEVEKWIGKSIVIPDSLPVYHNNEFICYSGEFVDSTVWHIISSIDGTCHQCIKSFELWQKIIIEYPENVQFVFIAKTNSSQKLLFFLERLHFDYPVIIDEESSYETVNQIDDISSTVLTNFNNQVVLIGNPLLNQKIKELQFEYLKNNPNKFFSHSYGFISMRWLPEQEKYEKENNIRICRIGNCCSSGI